MISFFTKLLSDALAFTKKPSIDCLRPEIIPRFSKIGQAVFSLEFFGICLIIQKSKSDWNKRKVYILKKENLIKVLTASEISPKQESEIC